ncbi:hypothetical protein ES703_42589 [subsurface metagenome]
MRSENAKLRTTGMAESNIVVLVDSLISNLYDNALNAIRAAIPVNKDSIFPASRASEPKHKNGARSQASSGPQYPLTALLKSPFRYFWAIEMYEIPPNII